MLHAYLWPSQSENLQNETHNDQIVIYDSYTVSFVKVVLKLVQIIHMLQYVSANRSNTF